MNIVLIIAIYMFFAIVGGLYSGIHYLKTQSKRPLYMVWAVIAIGMFMIPFPVQTLSNGSGLSMIVTSVDQHPVVNNTTHYNVTEYYVYAAMSNYDSVYMLIQSYTVNGVTKTPIITDGYIIKANGPITIGTDVFTPAEAKLPLLVLLGNAISLLFAVGLSMIAYGVFMAIRILS